MPAAAATATRAHAAEGAAEGGAVAGGQVPAPVTKEVAKERLLRRAWDRFCSLTQTTMLWMSTGGSVIMAVYQLVYAWQKLPGFLAFIEPAPGAQAWLVGIAMFVGYAVSKVPHIFGQEPGDAGGLVREFALNEVNLWLALILLVSAYFGAPHAPNAVGISVFLLIGFVGLMIGQLVQAIVLSRRTWTDSSGAAASA